MKEYNPRENFEGRVYTPNMGLGEMCTGCASFTDDYVKYLEEQNKQMLRTLKRVYFEECNSDSCDNCPVVGSCVFQELKDTIESITGKKIEVIDEK